MENKLNKFQQELLNTVIAYRYRFGFSPSYRELGELLNRCVSTIKVNLDILRKNGYVEFEPRKSRTVKVLKGE